MSLEGVPTTDARLHEIAADIARIAPVVKGATDKVLAGEMPLERAEAITRSAEVLLGLWELESDLILARLRGAPKVKGRGRR